MWIQLSAAFVCSDKSSYVQGLSLSDFNQFSGEECAGDTDQDLPSISERRACVRVRVYVCAGLFMRMSEQLSDSNCQRMRVLKSFFTSAFVSKEAPQRFN